MQVWAETFVVQTCDNMQVNLTAHLHIDMPQDAKYGHHFPLTVL